jgi:hypothetical protein
MKRNEVRMLIAEARGRREAHVEFQKILKDAERERRANEAIERFRNALITLFGRQVEEQLGLTYKHESGDTWASFEIEGATYALISTSDAWWVAINQRASQVKINVQGNEAAEWAYDELLLALDELLAMESAPATADDKPGKAPASRRVSTT